MRNRYSTLLGLMLLSIAVISSSCKVKFEEPKKLFDQGYYRQSAVLFEEFTKTNNGKAYYTSLNGLGEYIFRDFKK